MAEQGKKSVEQNDQQKTDQQKTGSSKVTITFIKPWSRYSRGDVAGFTAEEADRLVKGKVAVKGSKLPAAKQDQEPEPKA